MRTLLAGMMVLVLFSGCFGSAFRQRAEFHAAGDTDIARDKKISEALSAVTKSEPANPKAKVYIGSIPEGIEMNNNVVSVKAGYDYVIMGRFMIRQADEVFPSYDAGWKKPYCYPQRVLSVATLGVWMLVPVSWPCNVEVEGDKSFWVEQAKRTADAAGADFVVGSYVRESGDTASGVMGYLVRSMSKSKAETNPAAGEL